MFIFERIEDILIISPSSLIQWEIFAEIGFICTRHDCWFLQYQNPKLDCEMGWLRENFVCNFISVTQIIIRTDSPMSITAWHVLLTVKIISEGMFILVTRFKILTRFLPMNVLMNWWIGTNSVRMILLAFYPDRRECNCDCQSNEVTPSSWLWGTPKFSWRIRLNLVAWIQDL